MEEAAAAAHVLLIGLQDDVAGREEAAGNKALRYSVDGNGGAGHESDFVGRGADECGGGSADCGHFGDAGGLGGAAAKIKVCGVVLHCNPFISCIVDDNAGACAKGGGVVVGN